MTTTELETVMFVGFAALARCADPEKLPFALEYVNGIIGNERAKLSAEQRSALQCLFDVIELRGCAIELEPIKPQDGIISHLKIV